MTKTLSIKASSDQTYFTTPLDPETDGSAPQVCISLLAAGDMWGSGRAAQNRKELLSRIGVDLARVRSLRQVHSKRVVVADELTSPSFASFGESEEADGLVTVNPELVLSVRVADCFPIFLFDRRTRAFAAVHSGWRGTGIAARALGRMESRYGTRANDVCALVGPGIRACCYDVPKERAESFRADFGETSVLQREGRQFLDLSYANERLLRERGVERITLISDCTSCTPYLGSYRRQGPERFTHMLALVGYFG